MSPTEMKSPWVKELRPQHWLKNIFVFAPGLFSGQILNLSKSILLIEAFVAFSILASAVYLFNDVMDIQKDRMHPIKKDRPIAAGIITTQSAVVVSVILCAAGIYLSYTINSYFLLIVVMYLLNNVAYSVIVKEKVIADILSISIGFMLRFIGGAFAIDVDYSRWFLVCSFSLSLFFAFGKRRTEVQAIGEGITSTRRVLESYSIEKLDMCLAMTCALTITTYMMFTTAPETIALHKSKALIYTVPIVVYSLLRYMYKVIEGKGSGPVEILVTDKAFILSGIVWLLMTFTILYL